LQVHRLLQDHEGGRGRQQGASMRGER
jgi:hypothetical protein